MSRKESLRKTSKCYYKVHFHENSKLPAILLHVSWEYLPILVENFQIWDIENSWMVFIRMYLLPISFQHPTPPHLYSIFLALWWIVSHFFVFLLLLKFRFSREIPQIFLQASLFIFSHTILFIWLLTTYTICHYRVRRDIYFFLVHRLRRNTDHRKNHDQRVITEVFNKLDVNIPRKLNATKLSFLAVKRTKLLSQIRI